MIRAQSGQWFAVWKGGRIADVFHVEIPDVAQACIEALPSSLEDRPDWFRLTSEQREHQWDARVDADTLGQALQEWEMEDGRDYRNNLNYR